ncbi:TPA: hypothetical protein ACN983_005271, partial [Vibrio parahaemolyticus]
MADKFFIVTCNPLKRHKDNQGAFVIPVTAGKVADAEQMAMSKVLQLDPIFGGDTQVPDSEIKTEYRKWYQAPNTKRELDEAEFNVAVLNFETTYEADGDSEEFQETIPDKPYPALGNDGFYDAQGAEVSQTIYNSTDENMQAAKVFVLNVGHGQWSHGFRCTFGSIDKHERMNLDRVKETRALAIDAVIKELKYYAKNALDFVGDDQKPFLSFVLEHNFNYEFWESSEKFIHAIKKHSAYADAAAKHQDFAEVVE